MDDRQISTSKSGKVLCSKPGLLNIKNQMEPGDATSSKYEEAILRDKILRVLSNSYKNSDITFLFKNENFFNDPSLLSYYEDETELESNIYNERNAKRGEAVETTVSVVCFPREQYAEFVTLARKKNALRRFFRYIWNNMNCTKTAEN